MLTIQIPTAQNIMLEYEVASVGDRILAYLIDIALFAGCIIILVLILSFAPGAIGSVGFLLLSLPILFYQLICEIFLNGQSIGKKVLNIKVISTDGAKAKLSQYLLRWLFRFIDITLSSGTVAVVSISFSGKNQRIGDIVAGTTVIKTVPHTKLEDTVAEEVSDDYSPVFNSVLKLSDKDISLVKEVLITGQKYDNWMIVHITADKIKSLLKIESELPSDEFLLTVIRDYNYLTTRQNTFATWENTFS